MKKKTAPEWAKEAERYGRLVLDATADDAIEDIVLVAVKAAHCGRQYLAIRERVGDPVGQIYDHQQDRLARLATTERCSYRRVVEKNGRTKLSAPCDGKLKPVKRHGKVVAGACVRCGREYPIQSEDTAKKDEAAA